MEQYIKKSAVVAEIERRIKECDKLANAAADNNLSNTLQANELLIRQYTSLLHYLDTLEVKEVEDKCKDCTNSKGCINCEDGNMYEKTKQEMLKETPNEEFENFSKEYMEKETDNIISFYDRYAGLVDGVRWQKVNLWKDAQGDDLPEINREVIVLVKALPEHEDGMLKVGFGHRPPEYWDGKNILTGEVTRYYPKKYDKGGWNHPDVVYWLDCKLPFKEEE